MALPTHITLEVVTPAGLLFRDEVEEVIAPGEAGYFGVRPGHTPFLSTLGVGEITYRQNGQMHHLTCFWGFCEVLPDRVNILAEVGERAEDLDRSQIESALAHAKDRMKSITDEAGYKQAHDDYVMAVTRLAVSDRRR
jgi:F-type H+-transporting ATPase subunit epsilon